MKQRIFFIFMWLLILLLFSLIFSFSSFAQNYTRLGLPEGAIARFGKGYINDVKYSPDGTRLAVATSIGVWLYDTSTDTELTLLSEGQDYVQAIAFSPDGSILDSGGYLPNPVIRLWDAGTGKLRGTLEGSEDVLTLAFSPDGSTLAVGWSGWQNNRIQLLDTETLQPFETLVGHIEDITDLAFSPDGGILASGSCDGTILLWRTGSETVLVEISEDVNGDGSVNIDDLTFVAARLGHIGEGDAADVNGDGVVNILDLVAVAGAAE